jgi:YfiR/HmsC-like
VRRIRGGRSSARTWLSWISGFRKRLPEILANLRGTDALTVGETEGFAPGGGIIQLVLRDNRVRLMVNVEAAERARLKISSKLLALAEIVRDEPYSGRS